MFIVHDHMPCRDQDETLIKNWFVEHAVEGLIVAIRNTHGGIEGYVLDEISEIRLKPQLKFYTKSDHAWGGSGYSPNGFTFKGISTQAPTGQAHAVIPTPIITECALRRMDWLYGRRGHEREGTGSIYNDTFQAHARTQYQDLFPGWTVERAMQAALDFHRQSNRF